MNPPVASQKAGALSFLGLQLHPVDVNELHGFIETVILRKEKALIPHLNVHGVNLALRYPWMKDFINGAQLVFCDGDGVRWGAKLLGLTVPPKITYDRWIWQLAAFCEKKGFRIFFLGGRPGVAQTAADRLKGRYPQLAVVGVQHGYFRQGGEENEKVIEAVSRVKPDILIVGLGMPRQEKWLSENWQRIPAHAFLTGGAVFDYASGRAKRAPEWMIRAHLEWLFRLIQEPRRLFGRYLWGIPVFFFRVFRAMRTGRSR